MVLQGHSLLKFEVIFGKHILDAVLLSIWIDAEEKASFSPSNRQMRSLKLSSLCSNLLYKMENGKIINPSIIQDGFMTKTHDEEELSKSHNDTTKRLEEP
ncbi:hypothetical protein NC653_004824 [Populus alba x Populus x berolinensis]|uniref:Uncharacterized protein n=1 Tax=Populus alba x Populus x berolinensis TaxID=444605 RepID=A0AAD6RWH1_9ROSI|nr:hypothetical protein NC653_004824 [Populus alba x Populus x berolinensis]